MKNINENELKNYIFKKLQESYFDDMEFDNDAMKAAMSDMEASGEEFEELGASKFEKDPKFAEKFKSALNRVNLELPSDEEEVERLAQMVKSRNDHEGRFGKGSLNETEIEHIKDANGKPIKLKSPVQHESGVNGFVERFMVGDDKNMLVKVTWIQSPNVDKLNPIVSPEKLIVKENMMEINEEAYEASRYMFFSNLEQIRRQAGLLLDLDEDKINEILENGHDWAQDHIATAKESIDQVFDFLMNETQSGDMWKSVDVDHKEDEEEGSEFEEEIEEGIGRSHTIGANTNEKPVNYPEELMREAVKGMVKEALGKFTSTASNTSSGGFKKANLSTQLQSLSKWMLKTFPNQFLVNTEMPPKKADPKDPDAKKPIVYMWIPSNNTGVINVEYRNIPNAVNHIKSKNHIETILKAYALLGVLNPLSKTQSNDSSQATFSLSMKATEAKPAATTAKPALAESFMKEDEHFKLSFLDKIKLKLAGVSEEDALKNLNNNLPIDWTGSKEGYYDNQEPRGDYSGTNEGLEEDMDKTDYEFNQAGLEYEREEEARRELGDELYYVLDDEFNNANYPDLVGKTFPEKPADGVNVKKMGESSSDSLTNKHSKNAKPNNMEEGFMSSMKNSAGKAEAQNAEKYIKVATKDKLIQAIKNLMSKGGGAVTINTKGEGETQLSRMQKQYWTGSVDGWNAFVDMATTMEESSSDSLINKRGTNAKPNAAYLKEGYEDIVHLQDNEANHAFTLLKQDGPEEVIEYLKEWHKPGTHNILSEVKKSVLDKSYEKDGYTLTWNPSVGHMKLSYDTKK